MYPNFLKYIAMCLIKLFIYKIKLAFGYPPFMIISGRVSHDLRIYMIDLRMLILDIANVFTYFHMMWYIISQVLTTSIGLHLPVIKLDMYVLLVRNVRRFGHG